MYQTKNLNVRRFSITLWLIYHRISYCNYIPTTHKKKNREKKIFNNNNNRIISSLIKHKALQESFWKNKNFNYIKEYTQKQNKKPKTYDSFILFIFRYNYFTSILRNRPPKQTDIDMQQQCTLPIVDGNRTETYVHNKSQIMKNATQSSN